MYLGKSGVRILPDGVEEEVESNHALLVLEEGDAEFEAELVLVEDVGGA